jgi:hypothetical protein
MSDLHDIRIKLTLWGRLCRAIGIGYPTMSSHEKARVGRGGLFDGPNLPQDIAELDVVIARSPPQHKLMLVEVYTKSGDYRDHAARLNLSVDAFYRRKKRAEVYLNTVWTSANGLVGSRAS